MLVLSKLPDTDEAEKMIADSLYEYSIDMGLNGIDYGGDKHYTSNDGVDISVLMMLSDNGIVRAIPKDPLEGPDLIPDDFQEVEDFPNENIPDIETYGQNG